MKKILLLFLLIQLIACSKDDNETENKQPSTNTCQIDSSLLVNVTWHHLTSALPDLTFSSDGALYVDFNNTGSWTLPNHCDSIYVTSPSNDFYFKIISLSKDSLHLKSSSSTDETYFK